MEAEEALGRARVAYPLSLEGCRIWLISARLPRRGWRRAAEALARIMDRICGCYEISVESFEDFVEVNVDVRIC